MEDCKINYDYTVRNASGSIVQFLYGEDGMDASKIESQFLPYIDVNYAKLRQEYLLTEDDNLEAFMSSEIVGDLKKDKTWVKRMEAHFKQVQEDRDFMIHDIFKKKKEMSIMYPVSFTRIINNARAFYGKYEKGAMQDLSPVFVLDTIEKLCEELYISNANKGNKFMNILLRCYLSPKKVIFDYKFSKTAFTDVIQTIKMRFYDAIAHPSEMVGVTAAQSIGEP